GLQTGRREVVRTGGFIVGDRLLAIDGDGYATVIDPGKAARSLARANPIGFDVASSGGLLALPNRDRVTLWDAAAGTHLLDVPAFSAIHNLAISPDARTVALVGDDPAVLLINVRPPRDDAPADELSRVLQVPSRVL